MCCYVLHVCLFFDIWCVSTIEQLPKQPPPKAPHPDCFVQFNPSPAQLSQDVGKMRAFYLASFITLIDDAIGINFYTWQNYVNELSLQQTAKPSPSSSYSVPSSSLAPKTRMEKLLRRLPPSSQQEFKTMNKELSSEALSLLLKSSPVLDSEIAHGLQRGIRDVEQQLEHVFQRLDQLEHTLHIPNRRWKKG